MKLSFCNYEKEILLFARFTEIECDLKRKISAKVYTQLHCKIYYAHYEIFRTRSRKQLPRSVLKYRPSAIGCISIDVSQPTAAGGKKS